MHAELPSYGPRSLASPAERLNAYLQVLHALMLRDMRTRFGASWWGYLVQVMWPVAHLFVISLAALFRKIPPPFGDSILLFAASGAIPALAFQYISREVMKGVSINRALTYYPQVRVLDVMFARIMVEIVNSFLAVATVFIILVLSGINPIPVDMLTALSGYLCAILLGISIGSINVAIVIIFPPWVLGYIVIQIGLYMTGGVFFMAVEMSEQIYRMLKWNPVVQIVEWVRLGYDPSLPIQVDHFYVFMVILCGLTIGLSLERTVARRYAA